MSKKFEEEKIDTAELKENVFNQGKWLRLLWIALFLFIYAWASIVLYVIAVSYTHLTLPTILLV